MARSILVLILAAVPALAQYNANTYNVRPSGGSVGQVCFYETAANGSNKVCLSAAAALSGDVTFKWPTADGSAGQAITTDGSGQLSWSSIGSPPFSDATPIIKDNTDATKELLFSIGGFTTATQRTVTVPDASFIMAGRNVDNAFSVNQTFGAHVLFGSASAYDIADATNYAQTLYVENISAAPSGVTGNYVKARKFEIADNAGGTTLWDFQVSQVGGVHSFYYVRDNAGTVVHRLVQLESVSSVNEAQFMFSLVPGNGTTNADNTYDVGTATRSWRNGQFDGTLTTNNLTVTGTCTGCGGGTNYWTLSSGDVRPATDGNDVTLRTSGGTQTHRLRASDGAHLAGSIYTGASPTWTQRIDASGNVTALSLTVNGTYFISSAGAALLGTVSLGDIYQSGPTVRLSSAGVFNGASFNVAGTEVISSGRVFKPVSLDVNGTANVIDSSRNATFTGLTFGASSALVQGSTTRISTGGKGTFVGVEFGSGQSLDQGGTSRIDSSGNGRFASLYIGATQRIDASGNMNTPSITIAGSWAIGSGGTAVLGSVFAADYWQGATSRISSSGVFNAASYQVSSTSVIDSSRNTNFVNLKATGQLWFPYTDDNSWAIGNGGTNTTAKLAIYDTNGSFIGWVPVFP